MLLNLQLRSEASMMPWVPSVVPNAHDAPYNKNLPITLRHASDQRMNNELSFIPFDRTYSILYIHIIHDSMMKPVIL